MLSGKQDQSDFQNVARYNNKTYRVDDIDWDSNPQGFFKKADGSEISFVDYYKKQYNQEITDLNQPVLVSQPKRKTGPGGNISGPTVLIPELCFLTGLTDKMRSDFNVMKDLAVHTRLAPEQRMREVGRLIDYINKIEVEDRTEAYLKALKQKVASDTQMVVCLLSSNRKDKYDAIKKYLCSDCPTPSQCVLARTLSKPQTVMAIATKIALQMNCKMGGELWSVEIPLTQLMIVGIDCYHDTTSGRRSIAGFVASLNRGITRWYSRCVVQDRGQELVDGLKVCLQAALRTWYTYNNRMPARIIVYRDGVGDGQLKTLVNYEVPQFLECLKAVGKDYSPKLTVIVVKKRVNTRFFAQVGGRLQNPPPGTVIDLEVTRPEWYDFFIVSQAVRTGSVSPTHYNVIYDNSALKPDYMQRLTYKLCHMYYNWP
ncbi:UNVERIFIED_CONTAM: Piwi-like protein 1, partial [Gekko kuhli]